MTWPSVSPCGRVLIGMLGSTGCAMSGGTLRPSVIEVVCQGWSGSFGSLSVLMVSQCVAQISERIFFALQPENARAVIECAPSWIPSVVRRACRASFAPLVRVAEAVSWCGGARTIFFDTAPLGLLGRSGLQVQPGYLRHAVSLLVGTSF